MKIYIGPFKNYIGPYQLVEKFFFWVKKEEDEFGFKRTPDWIFDIGTKLSEKSDGSPTIVSKICQFFNRNETRKVKIRLDRYDSWNVDGTLAYVILPLLQQLKKTQHGSPMVDMEDLPPELALTKYEDWSGQQSFEFEDQDEYQTNSWELMHKQWAWILDEIIWAFEQIHPDNDWESQYHSGVSDIKFVKVEGSDLSKMVRGENDTHHFDLEGYNKHDERIQRGLKFFGKYYRGLWD